MHEREMEGLIETERMKERCQENDSERDGKNEKERLQE